MDFNNSDDDLTDDDDEEMSYRDRAAAMLDQIAQQVKQALVERGFDLEIFFVIPKSGDAIITFGTLTDPSNSEWETATAIVSAVVSRTIKLDQSRCRTLACTMADTVSAI